MKVLLRLIRIPNLLIIVLAMLGVRYGILGAIWSEASKMLLEMELSNPSAWTSHLITPYFLILMGSVVLIAAGGYIINDYFDVKTDYINKPDDVMVGLSISKKNTLILYFVFSLTGLALGITLAFLSGNIKLAFIQFSCIVLLALYSAYLKKQMLSGNLLIAFLTAIVPLITGFYEFYINGFVAIERINLMNPGMGSYLFSKAVFLITGFALFAFLTNLIREIIKDVEDIEGDIRSGCRTLPVLIGVRSTQYIVLFLLFFSIGLLAFIQERLFNTGYHAAVWYLLFFVQAPMLYLVYVTWKAQEKRDYAKASLIIKMIIFSGIFSMFLYRYFI